MGRFYCDYCHCYLTHDSASVRKAHNVGRNHLQQVKEYYSNLGFEKTQSVLDSIAQDYQSAAVSDSNPFTQSTGLPSFAGRPGYTTIGGMTFGGPLPGMPLPPPPGMPLPGGQIAQLPSNQFLPPLPGFPPVTIPPQLQGSMNS